MYIKGYRYFWYHGGLSTATREAIGDAIDEGDVETLRDFQRRYPKNLPKTASYFDENGDITSQGDILDPQVINNLIYHESENG